MVRRGSGVRVPASASVAAESRPGRYGGLVGLARAAPVLLVALACLAGCGGGGGGGGAPPPPPRVAVIVLENRELRQVIDNPGAPYLTALAHRYALVARS